MARDPYSYATRFAERNFAVADYEKQALAALAKDERNFAQQKELSKFNQGITQENATFNQQLDDEQYQRRYPMEIEKARATADIATDAYGERLDMRGELKNPRAVGAEDLISEFEGFREKPYWDVNAHRVGYGSDTVTNADGSVSRVTPGTRVDRVSAQRDLSRRTMEFQQGARAKIGPEVWDNLPSNAQAALTSVAYNYGSIPDKVAKAAKTGDINALRSAVEGLAGDNGGVNAKRRKREAALIRAGGSSSASSVADPVSDTEYGPRVTATLSEMGMRPAGRMKIGATQLELMPASEKAKLFPDYDSPPDKRGTYPYIIMEPIPEAERKRNIAGGKNVGDPLAEEDDDDIMSGLETQ